MSVETSPTTGRVYGVERVCDAGDLARSTFYAHQRTQVPVHGGRRAELGPADEEQRRARAGAVKGALGGERSERTLDGFEHDRMLEVQAVPNGAKVDSTPKARRGPKPSISDEELLQAIREDIEQSPFIAEGYRKIWCRLRRRPMNPLFVSRQRVLRLMRQAQLLSPHRCAKRSGLLHDGYIVTDAPNVIWATDGTRVETSEDGQVWVFIAVEHWNAECVGIHVAKKGDRFAALEPIARGLERYFKSDATAVRATGLALRTDHGSQYTSEDFVHQVAAWGLTPSYALVRQPETNGVAERFIRTLKEQVFHGRIFRTVAEVRQAVDRFVERYNNEWLVQKNGLASPLEARRNFENARIENRAA
jgi:putative transposase